MRTLRQRHAGWVSLLERLRGLHARDLGRNPQPVGWIAGDTLGPISWLGYFWEPERFWFGYGFHLGEWMPLIEADIRRPAAKAWLELRAQLPGAWTVEVGGAYARLWATLAPSADAEQQFNWFAERSRELHEYSLSEK